VLSVTKFVAFGDSLTVGENGRFAVLGLGFIDPAATYPVKLQSLLNSEYPGQSIVVSNRGVSGEAVEAGVRRLPDVLSQERGGALLLLEGYNDLFAWCKPQDASTAKCTSTINEVVDDMRKMIQIGKTPSYGIKYIFVSTLTPPGPYVGGNDRRIAGQAIVQTNTTLASMVRTEGAVLVDSYPAFIGHEAEYVDQDGLHLRPAGYQALADTFFAAIRSTVTSTPGFGGIHY
jgi:lysophospholipase L1-like esterase